MSIQTAIQERRLLTFTYDGYSRTVEPHTYGIDNNGHYALRAFQTGGGSDSGQSTGWKLFHQDEMMGVAVSDQTFAGPRQGYRRNDSAFSSILAQL